MCKIPGMQERLGGMRHEALRNGESAIPCGHGARQSTERAAVAASGITAPDGPVDACAF